MISPVELQSRIITDETAVEIAEKTAKTYLQVRTAALDLIINYATEAKEGSSEQFASYGPGLMKTISVFQKCDYLAHAVLSSVTAENINVEATKALVFALISSGDAGKPFLHAMSILV